MGDTNSASELDRYIQMVGESYVPTRYLDHKDLEYRFWFRSLLIDLCSVFEFKGLPKDWPENFFKAVLFSRGYLAVFADKKLGLAFNPCQLREFDFYYQPTIATVSNAYYGNGGWYKEYEIGKTCEILKLNEDYMGLFDLIDYYAQKLANLSVAFNMAVANAKIPAIFIADTERILKSIEVICDEAQKGTPKIIIKNPEDSREVLPTKDLVSVVFQDLQKTYKGTELLENIQTVLDSWYSAIGYPSTVDKNAHILNEEADFQFAQATSKTTTWINCMNRDFEKINKLFKTNMEVDLNARKNMSDSNGTVSESEEQIDQ